MAAQPRYLHGLLPLVDPLLRRAALVIEPHHGPTLGLQIAHGEADARKQFPKYDSNWKCGPKGQRYIAHSIQIFPSVKRWSTNPWASAQGHAMACPYETTGTNGMGCVTWVRKVKDVLKCRDARRT